MSKITVLPSAKEAQMPVQLQNGNIIHVLRSFTFLSLSGNSKTADVKADCASDRMKHAQNIQYDPRL